MRVGVVSFPGSNCDRDTLHALDDLGVETSLIWHTETDVSAVDRVILPGGFSYGDYLRSGALAARSPVMDAIERRLKTEPFPVLGICNGFQILTERGLLPGALRMNPSGEFRCDWQWVRVTEQNDLFPGLNQGQLFKLPIAHREGSYQVPPGQLGALFTSRQVFLQYVDPLGALHAAVNPNGSVANIAGVAKGSVAGLMPHPERAMASYLGSRDGQTFLSAWLKGGVVHEG